MWKKSEGERKTLSLLILELTSVYLFDRASTHLNETDELSAQK